MVILEADDALRADQRRQPPHIPLEDALVHGELSAGGLDGVEAGGGEGRAPAGPSFQRQPVMVGEDAVGRAAAAFAASRPGACESASARRGRRFLLAGPQQVPVLLVGLVILAQRAQLLSGHRQRRPRALGGHDEETRSCKSCGGFGALRAAAANPVPSAFPQPGTLRGRRTSESSRVFLRSHLHHLLLLRSPLRSHQLDRAAILSGGISRDAERSDERDHKRYRETVTPRDERRGGILARGRGRKKKTVGHVVADGNGRGHASRLGGAGKRGSLVELGTLPGC